MAIPRGLEGTENLLKEFVFTCEGCKKQISLKSTTRNLSKKFCSHKCYLDNRAPWNKGLTKEIDERVLLNAQKTSEARIVLFQDGNLEVWNKGLTKETDERVLLNAQRTQQTMKMLMKDKNSLVYKNHMRRSLIGSQIAQSQRGFTDIEIILYGILDEIEIEYFKQEELFYWIVDALIPSKKVIVQADGEYWHMKKDVAQRDYSSQKYFEKCGYKVLRFWGNNLLHKRDKVKEVILHAL